MNTTEVLVDGQVDVERSDAGCVVHAHGELDIATLTELVPAMRQAALDDLDVVLDLSDVSFVDLAFVRAVLEAQARIEAHGHHLTITHPPHSLLRMIDTLHLSDLLIA